MLLSSQEPNRPRLRSLTPSANGELEALWTPLPRHTSNNHDGCARHCR